MATPKTTATTASVAAYLAAIADPSRRADCEVLAELFARSTQEPATLWGPSIVGFGSYHYRYASGHEGDACLVGFSSRKADISLYVLSGFDGQGDLLAKLGKYKTSVSCLHVKRLTDIDLKVLEAMIVRAVAATKARYS